MNFDTLNLADSTKIFIFILFLSVALVVLSSEDRYVNSIAVKGPPRPSVAVARMATPPFFFYEKVGGEIVVLSCNYLLDEKSS